LSNKSTERKVTDTSQSEEMSVFRKLKPEIRTSQVKTQVEHHLFPESMGYHNFREVSLRLYLFRVLCTVFF